MSIWPVVKNAIQFSRIIHRRESSITPFYRNVKAFFDVFFLPPANRKYTPSRSICQPCFALGPIRVLVCTRDDRRSLRNIRGILPVIPRGAPVRRRFGGCEPCLRRDDKPRRAQGAHRAVAQVTLLEGGTITRFWVLLALCKMADGVASGRCAHPKEMGAPGEGRRDAFRIPDAL